MYQNQSKLSEIISINYEIKQHTEYKSFAFLFSIFTNEHIPYRLINYFYFFQNIELNFDFLDYVLFVLASYLTLTRFIFFWHTLLINHTHNNVTHLY